LPFVLLPDLVDVFLLKIPYFTSSVYQLKVFLYHTFIYRKKIVEEYVKKKEEGFFIGVGGGSLSSTARFRMVLSRDEELPQPAWITARAERRAAVPNQAYVPVSEGDVILDCLCSGRSKDGILQAINPYRVFLFGEDPDGSPIIYAESINDYTPLRHLIPFGSILEFYNRDGSAFVS
jgi:hypothetical protein